MARDLAQLEKELEKLPKVKRLFALHLAEQQEARQAERQAARDALATQLEVNRKLEEQLQKLRQQLEQMIRQQFGRRSEKLDPNQLLLEALILDADGEARPPEVPTPEVPAAPTPPAKKKRNGRRPIPDHLPRKEILIDLPEEDKVCPITGEQRPLIGYEESEKLEYIPETLRVNVYKRAKYGSPTAAEENGVLTAPLPPMLLPRCLADAGMLAHIAIAKFDDHVPLNRIEKIFLRQGVHVSRKTMCDWLANLATALRPLERQIKAKLLECGVVHHDDSPVRMLDPGAGKTCQSRFWAAVSGNGPPLVHFAFSINRKQTHPIAFFAGYEGTVMCDEYAGYANIDCDQLQSCWAHARRHVEQAKTSEPAFATEVLLEIAKLYKVEKEAKEQSDAARQALRQQTAAPQLKKIFELLESRTFRPASPMTKAKNYILNKREELSVYVTDGRLPIDNNAAERAIRRVAVGRKNWLYIGSETGGGTAAVLMTLLGSCWANRVNPHAYLAAIIRELPSRKPDACLDDLLPPAWAEQHPEHILPPQS